MEDRQEGLATRRRLRAQHVAVIGRLGHVEHAFVVAMVEDGVDTWSSHLVDLGQAVWLKRHRHPCPSPDANLRIWTEQAAGKIKRDAENVLIDEEVCASELQSIQKAEQVEEEGVAAEAGEEPRPFVTVGDVRFRCERHRRIYDQG